MGCGEAIGEGIKSKKQNMEINKGAGLQSKKASKTGEKRAGDILICPEHNLPRDSLFSVKNYKVKDVWTDFPK